MDKYKQMVSEMETELKRILSFWINNTIDAVKGGFIGEIDGNNITQYDAEKGAVLNARILWTFSAAYNFIKNPDYLRVAERAYSYIVQNFWDTQNGGLFWSLNADGSVKNSRKQAYVQGFGIYGFSEYYRASGVKDSLDYAIKLYSLIEANFKDEQAGGYIEALTNDWQKMDDMRLSEKDANEPKSMNTHLHIIEPYTNLYRVWPDGNLKSSIRQLIMVFKDRIIDSSTSHFNLFFEKDWTIKSDIDSYGHDIEGAWLLNEAALEINDQHLMDQLKELSLQMVDVTLHEGLDSDGGIFYEKEDNHLDTDKHWWPQAEALVGLIDAYQNTLDKTYLDHAFNTWSFIKTSIVDQEKGEWFWKVSANGEPDVQQPKAGFWKCPYHNSRALMEAIKRINEIIEDVEK